VETERRQKSTLLEVALAQAGLSGDWEEVGGFLDDDEKWMRLLAAAALSDTGHMSDSGMDKLADAADTVDEDEEYARPVARAGIALAETGRNRGIDLLHRALGAGDVRLRGRYIHRLTSACTDAETAALVGEWLDGKTLESLADYSVACGLLAAGQEDIQPEITERQPDDGELRSAYLGYRCLRGDEEAAAELIDLLRHGESSEQLCSALYLGVGRVRSATTVLAAVADTDVTFGVKAECGSVLISRGHPGSVDWFQRVLKGASGSRHSRLTDGLCRGIEQGIRLMCERRDVNTGRFV
jgi:hypothetical protein